MPDNERTSNGSSARNWLIVGLGNPGSRYTRTRHNAGFWVIDALAEKLAAPGSVGAAPMAWKKVGDCAYQSFFSGSSVSGAGDTTLALDPRVRIALAKPLSYMNRSGEALLGLVNYLGLDNLTLVVVHDEVDLPCGSLRLKNGGSAGGHNGLRDIIEHFNNEFLRFRLGVGHPRDLLAEDERVKPGRKFDTSSWVLSAPGPDEQELLDRAVSEAVRAILWMVDLGFNSAQNEFNNN